jgi:hypothetical protein
LRAGGGGNQKDGRQENARHDAHRRKSHADAMIWGRTARSEYPHLHGICLP